ncbi:MAG: ABC transporter substrate-binding protein [Methylobacteriaceae bacterium]|jgi:peptide/nickel transport system substrate-binding protein|nr:ABC transporter substrate-binding protein [Methylobacteriaceae bacterium]
MKKFQLFASVAGLALAASLAPVLADTPADTLVIGQQIDDIITLDPAQVFEFSASEAIGNSYERIINYPPKDPTQLYGEVAESWTVSDDGKTITFKIRDGKKFASGNPLTAEDVVFSLQRAIILNQEPAFIINQFGISADNVKDTIKQTGPLEFTFTMDQSYAPTFVLNCLTSTVAAVVDKKVALEHEKDGDFGHEWLKTNYAGSGAYKITQWKANEVLILERNDNYAEPTPLKRVMYRHIKEISAQRMMLEKGDLDIARNLDATALDAISSNKDITIETGPKSAVYYLGLNQKNATLAKPEVREAMKYLIDYDAIEATLIKHRGKKLQYFLPQGMMGALDDAPYSLDVDKAKGLLEKAGLKDGFEVSMDTSNAPTTMNVAQAIQQTFDKGGVKLVIIPGDSKQTLTKYRARQHDIYIGRWGADYQDPQTNASTFAINVDNSDDATDKPLAWRNAWAVPDEMNKLTKASSLERDGAKRLEMYHQLQKGVNAEGPFIFLYQDIEAWASRAGVKGFIVGPSTESNNLKKVTK